MSPLSIDPLSWIYGIPFTLACFTFYRMPAEHRLKLELRKLFEFDAQVQSMLFSNPVQHSEAKTQRSMQLAILVTAVALSALSSLSFVSFLLWS